MSGGFKWIELGIHQVIFNEEDGKVLAHITNDAPNARKSPVHAYIDGKPIGAYINADFARRAVEEAMSISRQNAGMHAGKLSPSPTDIEERK